MRTNKPLHLLALSPRAGSGSIEALIRLGSTEVVAATDLTELLARIDGTPPDAIVLESAGDDEALRRIREVAPSTPILLLEEIEDPGSPPDVESRVREAIRLDRALHRMRTECDRMLRTVSHDLRSPIVKMAMFCDLLLRRFGASLTPEDVEAFDRFRQAQNTLAGELGDVVLELRRRPGRDAFVREAEKRQELVAAREDVRHLVAVVPKLLSAGIGPSKALLSEIQARHQGRIEPKADEYLEIIARSSRLLDRYAELFDLLERLQVEGRAPRRVDLGDVARAAAGEREARFEAAGGSIEIGELPPVQGLPDLLAVVFGEVLENALRHQGEGGAPRVRISARPSDDGRVLVRIEDDGAGFAPGTEGDVFAPFHSPGPSSETGSLGVGLSICRRIVEIHGGEIEARPVVPRGAAVEFDLPPAT